MRSTIRTLSRAVLIIVPALLGGCATSTPAPVSTPGEAASAGTGGTSDVRQALYRQLEQWRGTRYRFGGTGSRGIDCSGLTSMVYREVFDLQLPRTTERQGDMGRPVGRRDLAAGDLVFFKTGLFQRHVGIYVEDGRFIHASRSDGVRMSSLSSGYWRKRYWKARRVTTAM